MRRVPLSGLALEIAASAKNGKSSFEIRLDPAELGRIDVRIDVDRSGQVTSHLTVEKPETLSMLQQDAPQLQRALDDAGLKTGNGGLQFSLRDQSSSGQNSGNQPAATRSGWSSATTTPSPRRSRDEHMAACSDRAAAWTSGSEETDMTDNSKHREPGRFGNDARYRPHLRRARRPRPRTRWLPRRSPATFKAS